MAQGCHRLRPQARGRPGRVGDTVAPRARISGSGDTPRKTESPTLRLIGEEPGYWDHLRPVASAGKAIGPLVHDARLAAICRARGVRELWTADRDFSRYPGLVTRNPLPGMP